jgi:hypothetical protein
VTPERLQRRRHKRSLAKRKTQSQKEQIQEYKVVLAKRVEEKKVSATAAKERKKVRLRSFPGFAQADRAGSGCCRRHSRFINVDAVGTWALGMLSGCCCNLRLALHSRKPQLQGPVICFPHPVFRRSLSYSSTTRGHESFIRCCVVPRASQLP